VGLKPVSSKVGFMVNNLVRKVAAGRSRRMSGPAALSRPSPSMLSSFTSRLHSLVGGLREGSFSGAPAPAQLGGSFSAGSRAAQQQVQQSRPGTAGTAAT
jgi:hypothetical protein